MILTSTMLWFCFLERENPPAIEFSQVFPFVISPSYFAITPNTKLQRKSNCRDNLKYHLPSVRLKKPLKIAHLWIWQEKTHHTTNYLVFRLQDLEVLFSYSLYILRSMIYLIFSENNQWLLIIYQLYNILTCFPLGQISQHFSGACRRHIHLNTTIKIPTAIVQEVGKEPISSKGKECCIK